jgi:hypothetical protein
LPLSNHGIAKAGISSADVEDLSSQMGLMFGWFNKDHLSFARASICDTNVWVYICCTSRVACTLMMLRPISIFFGSNLIFLIAIAFCVDWLN